ncbi:MAG: hypothetical protein KME25_11260 [Symplocastrum torsivum CPER-KK1]|jgi:hypothetical protein|uniref:Uncharacterized protein n=1 Tax=Symplocastrum torsivum CPER-KK1 TaxID=450513 RepID=A0A951U960_9CYAN|nr:hypothetical protein [Symplocastrum torsivum CPER-KK1]
MKKVESEMEDNLRSEYDLRSLRVRRVGSGRKTFVDINVNNVLIEVKEDVTQGLEYWRHNEELSSQVKKEIVDANVLFVPLEGDLYRGDSSSSGKVFASGAESFFKYLLDSSKKEIKADICVNDGEYRKSALYSEPITLTVIGTIVISAIIAPVIKDLILDYIRANRARAGKDSEFRITLVIDNENGFIREIQCSGSSTEIEKFLPKVMDKVLNQAGFADVSTTKKLEESQIISDRDTLKE